MWFVVDSKYETFECVQNIVNESNYVAEYVLHDYPITEMDILSRDQRARDDMLNTINIWKFNTRKTCAGR